MQSPNKRSAVSLPCPPAFSGPQGWADLPDGLLHSIVARLASFRDILGFAATCPSWRAAFSSYPSKTMPRTKLPPLLVQPHARVQGPLLPATNGCHQLYTCVVIDPANPNTSLRCQIPVDTIENKMALIGSSYGNVIYFSYGCCYIVDVFTGAEVSTPSLPCGAKCWSSMLKGTLTAPLASPNSHLLVSAESSLFVLPVGNDSWSELQAPYQHPTDHFVEFDGQFIVLDSVGRSYALQLAPQLGLQEIKTKPEDGRPTRGRLVVCGDMLFMLGLTRLHRLDMSTEPATWIAVEKLDNWALFVAAGVMSTLHSCMSPGLWGGRSSIMYDAGAYRPWALYGLHGVLDPVQDEPPREPGVEHIPPKMSFWQFWLYPSMFYSSDGQ
uniref:Predicted protein n=1 Tax=Hordeum vulgare subsp. vulgare TaxID=112509 RepID=F2EK76_HORVV|nr:predicted protein [Hordeum vulgare subsp. vulgare]